SNLTLTEDEIDLIEKWIEQGAEYKPHWAFIPPREYAVPQVKAADWTTNEIDHFILSKLESKGLAPNKTADKERLLKRLSFDIVGHTPSVEIQDKFIADNSNEAYEKMVDYFLAQPQYGEKMAAHWMDVARYADSHGYQDDGLRT